MSALAALVLTGALFLWFNRLEQTGRSVTVVAFLVGLLLAECVLYQSQNEIPTGLIHPVYRGQSFRLIDLVIPVAILARLIQRPRSTPGALLWLGFLLWLVTAGIVGYYEGNDPTLVTFHGKAIIYLGTLFVAAGVPLEAFLADRRLERFVGWTATIAFALAVMALAGVRVSLELPLMPLEDFGVMGSDAATIFASLGAVALAVGLLADERRGRLIVSAVVLLATPMVAGQRAAFVALGVSLFIILVVMVFSRRRVRITPVELGLAALGVIGLLLLTTLPAVFEGRAIKLPLQDRLATTFGSYEEVLTTAERVNQFKAVRPLIEAQPFFGYGLGYQYVYYQTGFSEFRKTDLTHDILSDLVLRSGFVGLGLFVLALSGPARALVRGWSVHGDRSAAFALAVGAIVAGLLAKGLAESIFEKYRLAAFLGIGIGTMMAAGLPARADARIEPQSVPLGQDASTGVTRRSRARQLRFAATK